MLVEPSFPSTEDRRRLGWRWWEVKECRDSDDAGYRPFNCKQPAPATQAIDTSKLKETQCKECSNNASELICAPEETQASGKFFASIPIGQVEDIVRDESTFDQTQEGTACVKRAPSTQESLKACDQGPHDLDAVSWVYPFRLPEYMPSALVSIYQALVSSK